jgi:hypothetical protein
VAAGGEVGGGGEVGAVAGFGGFAGQADGEVCLAQAGRYPRFRLVIAAFLQVISLLRLM